MKLKVHEWNVVADILFDDVDHHKLYARIDSEIKGKDRHDSVAIKLSEKESVAVLKARKEANIL